MNILLALLLHLWPRLQRGEQGVLHHLRQDGGALPGHHRHQAAVLGEEHGQVGAAAASTNTVTWTEKETSKSNTSLVF